MNSLYLHIPFCQQKCHYCDFFSVAGSAQQRADYVDLLCRDIVQLKESYPLTPAFDTVYFGGGTPSLLTPAQLTTILTQIEQHFGLAQEAEISLEANPGTLQPGQLKQCRLAGINRLSLGIQSFSDRALQQLGRIHSAAEAEQAIEQARQAGFDNLSLDLIFALPEQPLAALDQQLDRLLAFQPEHISIYGLSFESGTELSRQLEQKQIRACPDELYVEHYQRIDQRLTHAGYQHYEISNFARPGKRSRHNQSYWQRSNCLAVGAGAHSFHSAGWGERRHIPADLEQYRRRLLADEDPSEPLEEFDRAAAMAEFFYLSLRTSDGADLTAFADRFGQSAEQLFGHARAALGEKLLEQDGHWRMTLSGWLLYDHLIQHFLLPDNS